MATINKKDSLKDVTDGASHFSDTQIAHQTLRVNNTLILEANLDLHSLGSKLFSLEIISENDWKQLTDDYTGKRAEERMSCLLDIVRATVRSNRTVFNQFVMILSGGSQREKDLAERLIKSYQDIDAKHAQTNSESSSLPKEHVSMPYDKSYKEWDKKDECFQTAKTKPSLNKDQSQCFDTKTPNAVTAKQVTGQLWLNNPSSQIFDKFYDRIVAVISKEKDLSDHFIETLYANFLFPTMEKKIADQLVCLDIKNRTVMRYLSTFINRSSNPEKALAKVLMILAKFPELETLATDMRKEYHAKIDIQIKLVDTLQLEIKGHFLLTTSSTFACTDLSEPSLTKPIKDYGELLCSTYKRWHCADTKWPQVSSSVKNMFVDLAIVENDPDCSVDDIIEKKKTPISLEDLCQLPCGSLILIEGAPGIGKSTLAYELCRQWSNGVALQHHHLVFLLQLRNKTVQSSLLSIEKLLGCYLDKQSWKSRAVQDIVDESGSGVLIILEGYDELPDSIDGAYVVNEVILRNILKATIIVTTRPSAKHKLIQNTHSFTHHIEVLGFTKASKEQYISKFFKGKESLHDSFCQHIKRFPIIEGCLYVPINLAITLNVFQDSFVDGRDSCLPETMTELYDTLIRMLIYRHLKSLHPSMNINFSNLKELPQPTLSVFQNLCKIAYNGICKNQGLVFYRQESFETLGLMQKESQMLPSKGGDVFVYNFLHLTIQEFLAAYHVHENQQEVHRLFSRCNNVLKLAIMMRFLAGLTKLESVHFPIPDKLYNCNIFYQFFEARNDVLTSELLSRRKYLKIARLSPTPTPLDMFMIGRCVALGSCRWRLGFTLRGMGSEHLEMFASGLNFKGEVKGQIEHFGFSLNPLGNKSSKFFFKLPGFIINNLHSLYLRGIEVDVNCLDNLVLAVPNLINLKMFLFHDNNFKEGEQKYFIESLCSSKFLQHVSFSRLGPDECETLLTNLYTLHTIELYQLSPPSVETVIRCLSNPTTLSNLQICQSKVKAEFTTYLPTTLPSSHLKSLEFINCVIDSVTVRIIADAVKKTPSLEKLNLSDNLIDYEGGHHLIDMIHSLTAAESLPGITHNLNEVFLDHNPFTDRTILRLVHELPSCLSRSAIKVRLSIGWQEYVQLLPTYPEVKEYLLFDRSNEYQ